MAKFEFTIPTGDKILVTYTVGLFARIENYTIDPPDFDSDYLEKWLNQKGESIKAICQTHYLQTCRKKAHSTKNGN